MKRWVCEMHGTVNGVDCPKCDDEMIAMMNDEEM